MLLWRLGTERRNPQRAEHVERIAARLIGVSFLLLAGFVAYEAVRSLALHEEPDVTPAGIALTAISLVVMPTLVRAKRQVVVALGSRAAIADSAQTFAFAWLVHLLVGEGREALTADHVDDC